MCRRSSNSARSVVTNGVCLHCQELLSSSSVYEHSKELKAELGSNRSRFFCPERIDFYRDQIVCDVEYLIETGKWEKIRRSKRQARDCELHENILVDHHSAFQVEDKPSAQDEHFVSDPSRSSVVELAELPEQDPLRE